MTDTYPDLSSLTEREKADLHRTTYFVLESYIDTGDHNLLASIEEAEEGGFFGIHLGLPDKPDNRYAFTFTGFEEAMLNLAGLKRLHPSAGVWLSCQEIIAEIEGPDVWRGAVSARAGLDPTDYECPWRHFAAYIAACDANNWPAILKPEDHEILGIVAEHLSHGRGA